MGGHKCPERHKCPEEIGIPPDSGSGWIPLSLMLADSHFIDWHTTERQLSLPAADVLSKAAKRSDDDEHCCTIMLTDVDTLSSCSRFSNSVVGGVHAWPSDFEEHLSMFETQCPAATTLLFGRQKWHLSASAIHKGYLSSMLAWSNSGKLGWLVVKQ